MGFPIWRAFKTWDSKAGEVRCYYEQNGYRHKFVFYPKDGTTKQTQIIGGSGAVRFEAPSLNQYITITMKTTMYAPQTSDSSPIQRNRQECIQTVPIITVKPTEIIRSHN